MRIRAEQPTDVEEIREILVAAFGRPDEADLVDRLRRGSGPFLSLVAEDENRLLGHILFTEVSIDGTSGGLALGLAPMAVRPESQRSGVGSRLVEEGLEACRRAGASLVVVLGHPTYYPRFGFVRADSLGLVYSERVPPEAFMALRLDVDPGSRHSGTVRYRPEFGA